MVVAVDGGRAYWIHVLPDTEVVVDERMVHPEDGVAGTGRHVGHDGADAVVAVGVGSDVFFLSAMLEIDIKKIQRKGGKGEIGWEEK